MLNQHSNPVSWPFANLIKRYYNNWLKSDQQTNCNFLLIYLSRLSTVDSPTLHHIVNCFLYDFKGGYINKMYNFKINSFYFYLTLILFVIISAKDKMQLASASITSKIVNLLLKSHKNSWPRHSKNFTDSHFTNNNNKILWPRHHRSFDRKKFYEV